MSVEDLCTTFNSNGIKNFVKEGNKNDEGI